MNDNTTQYIEVNLNTGTKRLYHEATLRLRLQALGCNIADVKALFEYGKSFCFLNEVFRVRREDLDGADATTIIQPARTNGAWGFDI